MSHVFIAFYSFFDSRTPLCPRSSLCWKNCHLRVQQKARLTFSALNLLSQMLIDIKIGSFLDLFQVFGKDPQCPCNPEFFLRCGVCFQILGRIQVFLCKGHFPFNTFYSQICSIITHCFLVRFTCNAPEIFQVRLLVPLLTPISFSLGYMVLLEGVIKTFVCVSQSTCIFF